MDGTEVGRIEKGWKGSIIRWRRVAPADMRDAAQLEWNRGGVEQKIVGQQGWHRGGTSRGGRVFWTWVEAEGN